MQVFFVKDQDRRVSDLFTASNFLSSYELICFPSGELNTVGAGPHLLDVGYTEGVARAEVMRYAG